ncbi:MAG: glycosyltransferase [Acidobacteria bacterium]|nr:glycosyltransferase [Acidobacteriota bacterium]
MNISLEQVDIGLRIASSIAAGVWILIALDRLRWWPSQWSLHLDAAAREPRPNEFGEIVAVVPARNEASVLPRTLPRLLKQREWLRSIVVVDDRSRDKTVSSAVRLADGTPAEGHLQVEKITETDPDWSPKTYAMQRGYEVATADWDGDPSRQWVLFTDADILHPAFCMTRLMAKVGAGEVDMISVMVRVRSRSFWEWLLIPTYVYLFQSIRPFRRASSTGRPSAASYVILVRRSALEEAGGLEAVRGDTAVGLALARAIRSSGGRCWIGLDPDIRSLRTYDSYAAIQDKVSRTAFENAGGGYFRALMALLTMAVLFVLPPAMMIYGAVRFDLITGITGAIGWILGMATYLPVVQYLGAPSGMTLALPLSAGLTGWMLLRSTMRRITGRKQPWREPTEMDLTA